jgi:hypothetical protein
VKGDGKSGAMLCFGHEIEEVALELRVICRVVDGRSSAATLNQRNFAWARVVSSGACQPGADAQLGQNAAYTGAEHWQAYQMCRLAQKAVKE